MVDREFGNHAIGVDSGLQRSSAAPGFRASDGKGGNKFQIEGSSVTVGYNREYSDAFDDQRQLLPEPIPPIWQDKLDKLTENWANKILNKNEG